MSTCSEKEEYLRTGGTCFEKTLMVLELFFNFFDKFFVPRQMFYQLGDLQVAAAQELLASCSRLDR